MIPSSRLLSVCIEFDPLLDLALESLAWNQIWDIIIVLLLVLTTLGVLLHGLVALSKLAERCEGVWAKLVKDTWDKLGELLVLTVTVDGEGVGWDSGVNCSSKLASHILPQNSRGFVTPH